MFISKLRPKFADPDDPDNYISSSGLPGNSRLFTFIIGGILGGAIFLGLFVAGETPLTHVRWQTTENAAPDLHEPNYYR